jgi:hypothetical protein
MSNLEKFTSVVQASLDPYFGSPLVFDESREKVSLWKNLLFIKRPIHKPQINKKKYKNIA